VSWKRHVCYVGIAVVGGFFFTFIAAILCTPLLWRLEPVLGIELAGHSGPSDWVLWLFFTLFVLVIEGLLVYSRRRSLRSASKT
jgi:hypothetical protein